MSLGNLLARAQRRGIVQCEAAGDGRDDLVIRVCAEVEALLVGPQLAFLSDPSTWALAYCSRQCGKGYTVARLMALTVLERPSPAPSSSTSTRPEQGWRSATRPSVREWRAKHAAQLARVKRPSPGPVGASGNGRAASRGAGGAS